MRVPPRRTSASSASAHLSVGRACQAPSAQRRLRASARRMCRVTVGQCAMLSERASQPMMRCVGTRNAARGPAVSGRPQVGLQCSEPRQQDTAIAARGRAQGRWRGGATHRSRRRPRERPSWTCLARTATNAARPRAAKKPKRRRRRRTQVGSSVCLPVCARLSPGLPLPASPFASPSAARPQCSLRARPRRQ